MDERVTKTRGRGVQEMVNKTRAGQEVRMGGSAEG